MHVPTEFSIIKFKPFDNKNTKPDDKPCQLPDILNKEAAIKWN